MNAAEDRPDHVCPRCKQKAVKFDHANQAWVCTHCHTSRVDLIKPIGDGPSALAAEEVMPYPPNAPLREVVEDRVRYTSADGRSHSRVVARYHLPKDESPPDLLIDAGVAGFVRYCFTRSGLFSNEKRYGRDWLREHGYVRRTLRLRLNGEFKEKRVIVPPELADLSDEQLREKLIDIVSKWEK